MAEAAPAPSAHDPGHRADQDQAAASDPAAGLVIEHHQQGTLVHGTQKNDHQLRRLLHDHGFRWSGSLNAWYLPRPWTFSTRNRRVTSLTVDLRQAHRVLHHAHPAARPRPTSDSPPEPLPAADPYTGIRQARSDHFQAISDYWALTRTPAGNNVMAAYPESGARPDALALNAAYKAVPASWDQAFAGDPHEVTGRFTAWVQAAAALARNLAAEQHRAPKFRQTLDTFISSATRLASRTQATAQDPAAWARVFADVPGNAPASSPGPEQAATPDPALPGTGDAATADTATEQIRKPRTRPALPLPGPEPQPGSGRTGQVPLAKPMPHKQPRGAGTGHSARQDVTPGDGKDAPDDTGTFQAAADGHDETRRAGPPRGHQVRPAATAVRPSAEQHAQSLSARSGRVWEFRFDLASCR